MSTTALKPLALAAVLLGMTIPTGLMAPSAMGASDCSADMKFSIERNIKRSSPLEGYYTTTELVHRVAGKTDEGTKPVNATNGVDAHVYDLHCETDRRGVSYSLYDRTSDFDPDLSIAFYDDEFEPIDENEGQADGALEAEGFVPENTRYIVTVLDEGPLVAGMDTSEAPPEPYSAQFELSFRK